MKNQHQIKVFKWNELKQKAEVIVTTYDTNTIMTKEQVQINRLKKELA
jgi:hypothetical protein